MDSNENQMEVNQIDINQKEELSSMFPNLETEGRTLEEIKSYIDDISRELANDFLLDNRDFLGGNYESISTLLSSNIEEIKSGSLDSVIKKYKELKNILSGFDGVKSGGNNLDIKKKEEKSLELQKKLEEFFDKIKGKNNLSINKKIEEIKNEEIKYYASQNQEGEKYLDSLIENLPFPGEEVSEKNETA